MNNLQSKVRQFLRSEDGPTAVEYAIMLGAIISVCVGAVRQLGLTTSNAMADVNNGLS